MTIEYYTCDTKPAFIASKLTQNDDINPYEEKYKWEYYRYPSSDGMRHIKIAHCHQTSTSRFVNIGEWHGYELKDIEHPQKPKPKKLIRQNVFLITWEDYDGPGVQIYGSAEERDQVWNERIETLSETHNLGEVTDYLRRYEELKEQGHDSGLYDRSSQSIFVDVELIQSAAANQTLESEG